MRNRHDDKRGIWRRTALTCAVAACFASNTALANPTGPVVTQGQATFATQGNTLTVTNAPGTVINWQAFSIAGGEITRFIQQSQISAVLNRVSGVSPSTILGTLQSNGRVFLVNPNGITIGPGANIDVAGFMASSLNLSDSDFLAGRMRFTPTSGAGSVVNQGTIATPSGGVVYLVGQDVHNSGIIRSPQGEIILAAGKSVELVDAQTPEVRVQVAAPDNQAVNLGQLIAAGGRIGMYGTLVKHSGVANANTAVLGENGKIVFKATKDVTLDAGSVTTANGLQGGNVTVQAETGTLLAAGMIEAKGDAGQGGTVQLLGDRVGLIGSASVDASGQTGGGMVLVGGDFQGDNPDVQNAQRIYVGHDVRIAADAIDTGDGGKAILWADDVTRFYGMITARGGTNGGNGGFAEVSGKNMLIYRGSADLSAPAGSFGTLLLDPRDITIQASGSNDSQLIVGVPSGEISGQILFGATTSTDFTLTAATVSASSANVVLQAQRDISINAPVTLQNDLDFVAQAGRDINVNAALTTNGVSVGKGRIHLEVDSPHSGTFFDGVGQVKIGAPINSCGGAAGGCAGGNITLIGGGNSSPNGGFNLNATVQAGNGGINIASSQTTTALDFFIGAGGNTQLSSNDTGSLKTTGALVLGRATTAGSDGLGSGALTLTVDSITNATASPIQLSADSGNSIELYAGSGGITLDRPLTTYQDIVIDTTGPLIINQTLATSGNDLTITASSVTLGSSGSINTGDGVCAGTGCPVTGIFWDGGGGDLNWFNTLNWSDNALPDANKDVTIETATGMILIAGGAAAAKSLIALQPVQLSSGSLTLSNASNFSNVLTLSSGGSLQGTGSVAISGPNGSLAWNAGTLASGGTFLLAGGRNGTLSGTLVLDRPFQNEGLLTLSGASVSGTGSFANAGTITVSGGTTNAIDTLIVNKVVAGVDTFLGTIQVNGLLTATNFPANAGQITVGSGGTFGADGVSLANTGTGSILVNAGGTLNLGSGTLDNGGLVTIDGSANVGTLTLTAGTVGGAGNLTVSTDFNEVGGSLGTTFANLSITKAGDFTVGSFAATNSLALTATSGALLDGNGASVNATAPTATFTAANGISLDTQVSTLTTSNTASGNIAIRNTGALAVGGMSNVGGGNILLTNNADIVLNGTISAGGNVTLSSTGAVTQNAAITAGGLELLGNGGSYTLTNTGNNVATLAADTGSVGYTDSNALSIGTVNIAGINATGLVDVRTQTGDLTLNNAIATTSTSANAVTLVADVVATPNATGTGGNFKNAGAVGITTGSGGAWRIYTGNPTGTTRGGLAESGKRYNIDDGSDPLASGDRIYFRIQPTLMLTADDKSKTYGDANPTFTFGSSGLIDGDSIGTAISSGPSYTVDGTTSTSGQLTAGTLHNITPSAATSDLGYSLAYANGSLTVNKLALAGAAIAGVTTTYGTPASTGAVTFSNKITGDDVSAATATIVSPAYSTSANLNAGSYKQAVSATLSGNDSANYTFAGGFTTVTNNYVVDPLALAISATGQNKVYDGGTAGVVTLADNRVSGDVLTTSYTAAAFNDKNAGTAKPVSVTGLGLTGTDAGNYTFNATAATAADIAPAVVSLAGNRAYDGSTDFGPGAFGTINGVNGETLTVASGTGTVASPKVLASTQSLTQGSLTLGDGSGLASNYTLLGGIHTGTITATALVPFAWDSSATDLRWENPANWNQGAVPLNGAMASIPGGLSGAVVYSSVSGATSLKTLSSASGFTITGGTLTLGNSTTDISTFSGRPLTLNGGTLNGVGTINLSGVTLDVLAGGVLGGSRTIVGDVYNLAGTVSPGASPGIMTINGDYTQGSLGTLLAEIGGTAAGQYDQLIVTGTVTLAGTLNVALVNGFVPATGDAFTTVQSGNAVSGTFTTTNLPSTLPLQTDYLPSSVNVTTGASAPVNTDQLISIQINQTNTSPPMENDMVKFIVITDPITNETVVMVGSIELFVSGGGGGGGGSRIQKPGVCR